MEHKYRGKAVIEEPDIIGEAIKLDNGMVVKDGDWVYGSLVRNNNGDPYIVGQVIDSDPEYIEFEFWVPVDPETVGQYPGLKDDDKDEVYGDDIVKLSGEEPYESNSFCTEYDWSFIGVVKQIDCCWWVCSKDKLFIPLGDCVDSIEHIKKLGNIHENPELMEADHADQN